MDHWFVTFVFKNSSDTISAILSQSRFQRNALPFHPNGENISPEQGCARFWIEVRRVQLFGERGALAVISGHHVEIWLEYRLSP